MRSTKVTSGLAVLLVLGAIAGCDSEPFTCCSPPPDVEYYAVTAPVDLREPVASTPLPVRVFDTANKRRAMRAAQAGGVLGHLTEDTPIADGSEQFGPAAVQFEVSTSDPEPGLCKLTIETLDAVGTVTTVELEQYEAVIVPGGVLECYDFTNLGAYVYYVDIDAIADAPWTFR